MNYNFHDIRDGITNIEHISTASVKIQMRENEKNGNPFVQEKNHPMRVEKEAYYEIGENGVVYAKQGDVMLYKTDGTIEHLKRIQ